ncbi:hypothetical protein HanXRQr2_Chr08g0353811 [Helianthus annuus]|uniref:Uncharacterized protein n=1 Tax=Helianthus annuus TaxID=4232 RepID=A0A251U8I1_HELAN|nr:hypothetical protein HanXRQr2_Chr08g0353811 [Helianthus annuus]
MRMMITGMIMLKMIDNDDDIDDGGGPTAARPPEPHRLRQWQWWWRLCFGSVWGFSSGSTKSTQRVTGQTGRLNLGVVARLQAHGDNSDRASLFHTHIRTNFCWNHPYDTYI